MKIRKHLRAAAAAICCATAIGTLFSGCMDLHVHESGSGNAGTVSNQNPSGGGSSAPSQNGAVPSQGGSTSTPGTNSPAPTGGITLEDAKSTAVADSGQSADRVTVTVAKPDTDNGRRVYDVSFTAPDAFYEYEISADNAAILEKDVTFTGIPTQSGSDTVTLEKAKQTALTHSGLDAGKVRWGDTEKDRDNGRIVWELEFYADQTEYGYEIDAVSGAIVSYKIDKNF